MLETVICLPLYMVLIGGMMWIGQLVVDRQKAVIADRYAAWAIGNRQAPRATTATIQAEIEKSLLLDSPFEEVILPARGGAASRWGQEAFGGITMEVSMPPWTRGWLEMGHVAWGAERLDYQTGPMSGRDIPAGPSGGYEGHVVLTRSPWGAAERDGLTPAQAALAWKAIAEGRYAYE